MIEYSLSFERKIKTINGYLTDINECKYANRFPLLLCWDGGGGLFLYLGIPRRTAGMGHLLTSQIYQWDAIFINLYING
jgi:hypothetical protein